MAKYGKARYGKDRYGKYELTIEGIDLSQSTKFRIRSIDSKKIVSRPIVNSSTEFNSHGPTKVRLRTDSGPWVYEQSLPIPGDLLRVRVRSVGAEESPWVEAVVGTIKNTI